MISDRADDDWERKLIESAVGVDWGASEFSSMKEALSKVTTSITTPAAIEPTTLPRDPNATNLRHSHEQLRVESTRAKSQGDRSTSIKKATEGTSTSKSLSDIGMEHGTFRSTREDQDLRCVWNGGRTDSQGRLGGRRSQPSTATSRLYEKAYVSSKQGFVGVVKDSLHVTGTAEDEDLETRFLSSVERDRVVTVSGDDEHSLGTRGRAERRASKRIRNDYRSAGPGSDDVIIVVDNFVKGGTDCNEGSVRRAPSISPPTRELPSDQEAVKDSHGCQVEGAKNPLPEHDYSKERPISPPVPLLGYKIPGPAGALQNSTGHTSRGLGVRWIERLKVPRTESRGVPGTAADGLDFREGPWLAAMDFLDSGNDSSRSTIVTIKATTEHIPQIVAIISTAVPNHFGDLSVTLKDPSGTIGGTIHRKVITEQEDGRLIAPGAVIILRKVAVFSPTPSAHYLNITYRNVDRIFGRDTIAPVRGARVVDITGCTVRPQIQTIGRQHGSQDVAQNCTISLRHGVAGVVQSEVQTLGDRIHPIAHQGCTVNGSQDVAQNCTISVRHGVADVVQTEVQTLGDRIHPIAHEGCTVWPQVQTIGGQRQSQDVAQNCTISLRHGVADVGRDVGQTLGNKETIQPVSAIRKCPLSRNNEDSTDNDEIAKEGNGNLIACVDNIAKAAGWDFSDKELLLLVDDDFLGSFGTLPVHPRR